jgi:sn-glycerol 3-phosphate transport system ATP-binding protein
VIKIEVEMLEQLGASTLVHGKLQGTETSFVVSLDGIQTAEIGTVLSFAVSKKTLHLFDADTGKRIDN